MIPQRDKFLLNLQFSPHDKTQMMGLCLLIARLQKGEPHADILLSPRYDCSADNHVVQALAKKFNVQIRPTTSRTRGWPAGCNAMALDSFNWFADEVAAGRMHYYAMMFGEADCIPLAPDWIEQLHNEWHCCDWGWHLGNRQLVLGPWVSRIEARIAHINGNCLISPKFKHVCPSFNNRQCNSSWGWDAFYAEPMMRFGRPSKLMYSDYHLDTPRNPWPDGAGVEFLYKDRVFAHDNPLHGQKIKICYLHGIKGLRGQNLIANKFLIKNP
jgi:hypothetical protein